jgi:hypothetical protein
VRGISGTGRQKATAVTGHIMRKCTTAVAGHIMRNCTICVFRYILLRIKTASDTSELGSGRGEVPAGSVCFNIKLL